MYTEILMALAISFVISVVLCPIVIPILRKLKMGQEEREEGLESHKYKSGTPTMGGMMILVSVLVTCVVFMMFIGKYPNILPVLFATFGFGLIGFLDDYIKVVKKRNLGLTEPQKFAGQFLITAIFVVYILNKTDLGTAVIVPFTNGCELELGWLFVPFTFLVLLGTVNGSNFTDGLDGLETSVTIIIGVFLCVVSHAFDGGIEIVCSAVVGALLGFFLFNKHPAKVFMGDTGSLALGGFVAASAFMLKLPLFIPIVAFIYLLEVISVILQRAYFKITHGKRIFKMAPIHHHYEKCGYTETQIVLAFAVVTAILCIVGYFALGNV